MQLYMTGLPLDRLHIDALGPFPESEKGNRYILVLVDQFTKWTEAYAVPNISSEMTAKCLVEEFIARFGAPLEIHTDQGSNFQSGLFKEVCSPLEMTQTRTTPYHTASNGQVERCNRTLLQMIRCFVDKGQKHWDEKLPLLLAAYRSTPHPSTGFTPNKLMLGREVHLPKDLMFLDIRTLRDPIELSSYIDRLQDALSEAHEIAREHLQSVQTRQKKLYDLRSFGNKYMPGDLVYISKLSRAKGKSPKLQSMWDGPFIVTKQHGPVLYEVKNNTKTTVVHYDRHRLYKSDSFPGWVNRLRRELSLDNALDSIEECDHDVTTDGDEIGLISSENLDTSRRATDSNQDLSTTTGAEDANQQRTRRGRAVKKPMRLDL